MAKKIKEEGKELIKKPRKTIKSDEIKPLSKVVSGKTHAKDNITIKLLKNDDIVLPSYAHVGDVGMDVTATDVEYMEDIDAYVYHTGLYCESEKNVGCFLMARSSNRKTDAYLPNGVGLVDTVTYRGEICFTFKNRTDITELALASAMMKYDEVLRRNQEKMMATLKTYDTLPFWKKATTSLSDWLVANSEPQTSFQEIWDKESKEMKKNALSFAPYKVGDRIGQMVFFTYPTVNLEIVDELSETERGTGGHGSTGK